MDDNIIRQDIDEFAKQVDLKDITTPEDGEIRQNDAALESVETVQNDAALESVEIMQNDAALESVETMQNDAALESVENVQNDAALESVENVQNDVIPEDGVITEYNATQERAELEEDGDSHNIWQIIGIIGYTAMLITGVILLCCLRDPMSFLNTSIMQNICNMLFTFASSLEVISPIIILAYIIDRHYVIILIIGITGMLPSLITLIFTIGAAIKKGNNRFTNLIRVKPIFDIVILTMKACFIILGTIAIKVFDIVKIEGTRANLIFFIIILCWLFITFARLLFRMRIADILKYLSLYTAQSEKKVDNLAGYSIVFSIIVELVSAMLLMFLVLTAYGNIIELLVMINIIGRLLLFGAIPVTVSRIFTD